MKKTIYLLIIICFGASCVKDLKEDPKGILSPAVLFANENGISLTANALGAQLANIVYNSAAQLAPFMGADDLTTHPASNKEPWREIDIFAVTDENPKLRSNWGGYYASIRTANVIIDNVKYSKAPKSVNDDCLGQAYFYRALCYSFLTRTWGEVPLIDKYSEVIDYRVVPSKVSEIYNLIISDCQKAEELLPETRSGFPGVRPIKGTAKALLSQVYLTSAGWPLKLTENYALAANKAKEVIDNAAKYGYELVNINDLWTWANNYTNKEVIFGLYYNNTQDGGWSGTMAAPNADQPQDEGGWGDYHAEIAFFNKFPAGPRKDVTYQTIIKPTSLGISVSWDDPRTLLQHPYFRKYTDAKNTKDWWSARTQIIIRYAEILLNYAEAKAMSSGVDQSAYDAINLVRNRAGLPNLTTGLSKEAFRDSVVAERGWEFAGGEPASRWFDLIRLERVEDANSYRDNKEIPLKHSPSHADYWMPIPSYEKSINPNLR